MIGTVTVLLHLAAGQFPPMNRPSSEPSTRARMETDDTQAGETEPAGRDPRRFGWYRLDAPWTACVPPEAVAWEVLTHIALAGPTVNTDFTAACHQTNTEKHVQALAKKNGVKVVWIIDEDIFPSHNRSVLVNTTQRHAFLSTVGAAATACGIDGIDADFEGWDDPLRKDTSCCLHPSPKGVRCPSGSGSGVGSDCDWNIYTDFLNDVREALNGGTGGEKTVSACLGNWDIVSWVNPKTWKGDWVSLMQYGNGYDNASAADYKAGGLVITLPLPCAVQTANGLEISPGASCK